jgi:hypothetical protein
MIGRARSVGAILASAAVALLAGSPLSATPTATAPHAPGLGAPAADSGRATHHVRLTASLLVVDREAVRRAGVSYVVLGPGQVRLTPLDERRRPARGVRAQLGALNVGAFIEAVRMNSWLRTETTQQVLALSGTSARVSSTELTIDGFATRSRGPVLSVLPTVLADGRIHLRVSAGVEDVVTDRYWGYSADGSPVSVDTELIVDPGEEVIIASGSGVESSRAAGLLHFSSTSRERDVLVVVRATVHP